MRRSLLAVGVSVVLHVSFVAAAVGVSAWRMFSMAPPIRVQTIAIDLVKELPLGAPASKEPPKTAEPPLPVRKPRQRVAPSKEGVTVVVSKDAGAPDTKPNTAPSRKREPIDAGSIDGGRRRPGDLRSNGPEGSRVIALLHLDRLRASPDAEKTTAALDQLLTLLPDRRRLIEGSGLDLYRDFDSLLIATPNPVDPSVTFLAARHHLGEVAMKAGLDRGAKAAQKAIRWQTVDGRPVGIRQQPKLAPSSSSFERDDRILVLPETNMAIIATPAYAAQLLGVDPANPTVRANLYIDGGVSDGKPEPPQGPPRVHWRDIVERIDAEDTAVPEDAAFMMSATNVFGATPSTVVVPGTRGTVDDTPPKVVQAGSPPPEVLTLVVGAQTPYIQVIAEFKAEADAERWEQDLPAWRRQLLVNPLVLVSGFSPLIRRAEISRDGANLELRVDLTVEEMQRLLTVVSNLTRTAFVSGRR